jgi:hypothetical protein
MLAGSSEPGFQVLTNDHGAEVEFYGAKTGFVGRRFAE